MFISQKFSVTGQDIFKGWSMVYPEYATLDRKLDDWGQCQQVPVVFAFVMLTINWVTERMHI